MADRARREALLELRGKQWYRGDFRPARPGLVDRLLVAAGGYLVVLGKKMQARQTPVIAHGPGGTLPHC